MIKVKINNFNEFYIFCKFCNYRDTDEMNLLDNEKIIERLEDDSKQLVIYLYEEYVNG